MPNIANFCIKSKFEACWSITARLKIKMLVVLRIFLLRITTSTTRRLPTKPMMMTRVKMTGTTMGTTAISTCTQYPYTRVYLTIYSKHNIYTQYLHTAPGGVSPPPRPPGRECGYRRCHSCRHWGRSIVIISANIIVFRSDHIISRQTLNVAHVLKVQWRD